MRDVVGSELPHGWKFVAMADVLAPLADGRTLHQGWSPKCAREPSTSADIWGVLKTTAVQLGAFFPEHNKRLPDNLSPRPQIEVKPGDFLLTCAGPRSRCGIACLVRSTRSKLMMSGKMYRFRVPEEHVNPHFVEAFFKTSAGSLSIDRMKTGSSDSGLNLTQARFKRLKIPIAPLPEQCRIVAKLDELFSALDSGVAALERAQAKLKRYRASVLKAAVEGKMTEEWRQENPPDETGEELLERILVERRKHWEEEQLAKCKAQGRKPPKNWQKKYKETLGPDKTDLPALPEGWIWSSIDQLIREPLRNGHSAKVVKSEDGVPIFSLSAVTEGDFSGRNIKTTSADPKKVRDLWVEINDIFIQRSNTPELVGTTRRYKEEIRRAIFPDLLIRIRILPPVLPDYVEYSLQSIRCHTYFRRNSQGSSGSMPKINQEVVRRAAIPIPPRLEQNTIVKVIEDQLSVVEYIATDIDIKLKGAQGLRQAILRHAFSGKLVPQHPKDEPASLLLERIRLAREVERPKKSRRSKISSQPTENA